MYNYNNNKNSSCQNEFPQQPPHQQQQKRDQHKAETSGNYAKLAVEEFVTLGEI